jgi:hypothetical protein
MAMVMLLVEDDGDDVAISSRMANELANLGVTSIAICRDQRTLGIVLEGWAFDPASADQAARYLVEAPSLRRVLLPAIQLAVSAVHSTRIEPLEP